MANDALAAALSRRLLIQHRKTLHRHKAEQLPSENDHLIGTSPSVVDYLSHMEAHNHSSEHIHWMNNSVRTLLESQA